jgi:hypothetical protein
VPCWPAQASRSASPLASQGGQVSQRDSQGKPPSHQVALVPEPEKYPIMSTKYYSVMGIWPDNKELYEAVNKEIAKAWADCTNVKVMAEYGLGNPS